MLMCVIKMMVAGVLFVLLLPGTPCEPMIDLRQFGQSVIERYTVPDGLSIFVEWDMRGGVSAVKIAPAKYSQIPLASEFFPSGDLDHILEQLFPGIAFSKADTKQETTIWPAGLLRDVSRTAEATLARYYPLDDVSKMVLAELAVNKPNPQTDARVRRFVSTLGPAIMRQFVLADDIDIRVEESGESVGTVFISMHKPLLSSELYDETLNGDAAESLIRRLLPLGNPEKRLISRFQSGGFVIEFYLQRGVAITYRYSEDRLTGVGVQIPKACT